MALLHAACFTVPRPWGEAEFAAFLADPSCFALFEPQGFILGRAVAGEAELLTLAVAPDARRKGLESGAASARFPKPNPMQEAAIRSFWRLPRTNMAARSLYAAAGLAGRRAADGGITRPENGAAVDALVLLRIRAVDTKARPLFDL